MPPHAALSHDGAEQDFFGLFYTHTRLLSFEVVVQRSSSLLCGIGRENSKHLAKPWAKHHISSTPLTARRSTFMTEPPAERFGGNISRVLASTFSRRAPSGELGKGWTWDDESMQWQRPASPEMLTDQSESVSSPNSVLSRPYVYEPASPTSPKNKASGGAKKPMTEDELRAKLRPLFDKFDVDSSGSISTSEMTGILSKLKIKMTARQIETMMKEADPDGSGEIEFEEFVTVLKKQMEVGGQLATVVEEASSLLGFLNPFNWFKSKEPEPHKEPNPPTKESPGKMTAEELRTKLRPVFDKFDVDKV